MAILKASSKVTREEVEKAADEMEKRENEIKDKIFAILKRGGSYSAVEIAIQLNPHGSGGEDIQEVIWILDILEMEGIVRKATHPKVVPWELVGREYSLEKSEAQK